MLPKEEVEDWPGLGEPPVSEGRGRRVGTKKKKGAQEKSEEEEVGIPREEGSQERARPAEGKRRGEARGGTIAIKGPPTCEVEAHLHGPLRIAVACVEDVDDEAAAKAETGRERHTRGGAPSEGKAAAGCARGIRLTRVIGWQTNKRPHPPPSARTAAKCPRDAFNVAGAGAGTGGLGNHPPQGERSPNLGPVPALV